tara:strand:+ start:196 stop:567 length:372 start_codon:yes stop_codon:yes gene_type:complete
MSRYVEEVAEVSPKNSREPDQGTPDPTIYDKKDWFKFITDNQCIYEKIKQLFMSKKNPFENSSYLDLEYIINALELRPDYVRQIMAIWNTNSCSFYYNYGRLEYNKNINLWKYTPNIKSEQSF